MEQVLTFGAWLKRRRKILDLTQTELATRAGCAVGTVRRLEADDLRPSRQVAERLAHVLRIPVHDRQAFVAFARDLAHPSEFTLPPEMPDAPTTPPATPMRAARLPRPATPLIGREHTIAAVTGILLQPQVRLVTLLGPPGVGKTRLGLEIARELRGQFTDGAAFVPLAPLADPGLVSVAIADALNMADSGHNVDVLVERLADRDILLLIDNMEHVVAAAPLLAHLLAGTSRLKLLVTSRLSLRLSGEHEFLVPPLALPDPAQVGVEALRENPAVALFFARARAVQLHSILDPTMVVAAAAICRRLDGLPLAIELAAMRAKVFPPQALLARLEQRLPLLSGGPRDAPARQQTVEAAIAWSFDLLTRAEQRLFVSVSVFAGGWTLPMAEALAGSMNLGLGGLAVFDTITALVDHSLLQTAATPDGEPRFTMLEIVREFAQARLADAGLADMARAHHARLVLELAEQGGSELHQAEQPRWLARLDQEIDNIRAAFDWSLSGTGNTTVGLGIAGILWWFWWASGRVAEGRRRLEMLLPRVEPRGPIYARALMGACGLAFWAGDFRAAMTLSDAAVREGQQYHLLTAVAYAELIRGSILALTGDADGPGVVAASAALLKDAGREGVWFLGTTRTVQTIIATMHDDLDAAADFGKQSLAIFRSLEHPYGTASALNYLGDLARLKGDRAQAGELYTASLALMRESGVRSDLPALLHNLGYVALAERDVARARGLFLESLTLHRNMGNRVGTAECLYGLASVATVAGDAQNAARLAGLAETVEATTDMPPWAVERAERQHYLAAAREQLAPHDWEAMVAVGRRITVEQVLAEAAARDQ